MSQSVMCLHCQCEHLTSDPQNSCRTLCETLSICNPRASRKEGQIRGSLDVHGPDSLGWLFSSRPTGGHLSNKRPTQEVVS